MNANADRARRLYRSGQQLIEQAYQADASACPPRYDNNVNGLGACGVDTATGCRVYALPINSALAIVAGATVTLPGATPQKPMKPLKFTVASFLGAIFTIDRIEIGSNGQNIGPGAVPAQIFSEVSTWNLGNYDPVGPGVDIILTITNTSLVDTRFFSNFWGIALAV